MPKLSRSGSSANSLTFSSPNKQANGASRFTTVSSSAPSPSLTTQAPTDSQYQLPPDVLKSLLASNSNNLDAFSQFQNDFSTGSSSMALSSGSTLAPSLADANGSMPNFDFSRALLPSPNPATASQPNPLESLIPGISTASSNALFSPSDFSDDYRTAIQDHSQVMNDVVNEKADIDKRTTALEAAIAKLMQTLPEETREALSSAGGVEGQTLESLGLGADFGQGVSPARPAAGGSTDGMQWGTQGIDNDLDLDQFLAQYGESESHSTTDALADPLLALQSTRMAALARSTNSKIPSTTPSSSTRPITAVRAPLPSPRISTTRAVNSRCSPPPLAPTLAPPKSVEAPPPALPPRWTTMRTTTRARRGRPGRGRVMRSKWLVPRGERPLAGPAGRSAHEGDGGRRLARAT